MTTLKNFFVKLQEIVDIASNDFKKAKVKCDISASDLEVEISIEKSWLSLTKKIAKKHGLKVKDDKIIIRASGDPSRILQEIVTKYDEWVEDVLEAKKQQQ